jgi:hypothetical protein
MSVRNIQLISSLSQLRGEFPKGVDIGVVVSTGDLAIVDPNTGAARVVVPGSGTTLLAADGAITIKEGIIRITKGSAAAITLAAPTAAQEGTRMTITSGSAFAHVITATGLLEDGVTGGAKNTATFAAFVGATCTLIAQNLKWHTESLKAVTVA